MELIKSHWTADANHVRLQMPISKVDEAKRQVSGFATLDNVDQQDDVVLASASKNAFSRFRGNIREMHQPIAAGRLVDFKEDSFYDSQTQKFYRGIYVTVYVSKGAEDTWQKVLDGTLSGFSIGGNINDAETEFVKDANKPIRFIKDFDLYELSLVDNPCNQFANVFSIVKDVSNGGAMMLKGMVAETVIENVFFCSTDGIAKSSTNSEEDCLSCGSKMERIGWLEKGEDETTKMQTLVTKFLRQKEDNGAITKTGEGGVNMTDENKDAEGAADVVTSDDVTDVQEVGTEEVAEVVEGSEDATNSDGDKEETGNVSVEEAPAEPDFEKMFDDLKGSVNDTLEKNKQVVEKAVEAVENKITEVTKSFDDKISEFKTEVDEIKKSLDSAKNDREEVAKRLETLEKATAIKKSGDVETAETGKTVQKGLWSGAFFKTDSE